MPRVKSVVTVIDDEGVVLAETNSEATFWAEEPPVEPPEPLPDEAPVLTLAGDAFVTVNEGDEWIEPGYSAVDVEDGDLTDQVVVTSNLDTAVPGTYTLYYSVQDSFGNAAAVERTVVVQPYVAPPLPPPEPPPPPSDVWNPPQPPTEGIRTATKTVDKTWKEVHAEIRGGGRIVVEPGHHILTPDDAYIYYSGWEMLEIVGVLGPNGERPLLDCQLHPDGRGIGNWIGFSGTNGNLWVSNVAVRGTVGNTIAAGSGSRHGHEQHTVLDNVDFGYAGHHQLMQAYEFSGRLTGEDRLNPVNDTLWIRDSLLHHSGYTHIHYCDRIAREVMLNTKLYSARGLSGHALKSIAREIHIEGCEISNVELDGSIDYDTSHYTHKPNTRPHDMYLGAVPVSLVAGQKGFFRNNVVTHRTHRDYNTGAYCVAQQARHNIHGLEVPDPMDLNSEFYDPEFWATAEDWSIVYEDNRYILLGDSADMPVQKVYQNQGTYPVFNGQPITPFPPEGQQAPGEPYVPKEWRERSRPICRGDRIRGFTLKGMDLYRSVAYGTVTNPTDDPVGRFTVETLPVEF